MLCMVGVGDGEVKAGVAERLRPETLEAFSACRGPTSYPCPFLQIPALVSLGYHVSTTVVSPRHPSEGRGLSLYKWEWQLGGIFLLTTEVYKEEIFLFKDFKKLGSTLIALDPMTVTISLGIYFFTFYF